MDAISSAVKDLRRTRGRNLHRRFSRSSIAVRLLRAATTAKHPSTYRSLSDGCALFGQVTIEGWPIMPLTMVAALILIGVVLQMTALGCSIYAVSGNPLASNSAGISVDRIQIIHLYDCLLHRRRRRLPPRLLADRHHLQPGLELPSAYATSLRFLPGASGSTAPAFMQRGRHRLN